ncbi:MAG: transcriptional regulator, partial [Pedobacter sp.]|nr:transcriptional regulator [Pedobacter sp.]
MRNSLNPLLFKSKYLFGSLLLLFLAATCAAFTLTEGDDFEMVRREVLLRKIGHELLLQSGDSTSRVLPVKKVANNNYQVSFERAFTFQPEALMETTQRLLATDHLTRDYIVKVMNCGSNNVAFGFAISSNEKENIIACKGRFQPKDCYIIDIEFKKGGLSSAQKGYLLGSLPLLAFVGLLFLKSVRPQKSLAKATEVNTFNLGAMFF